MKLEFEPPSQAFEYPARPEHSDLRQLLDLAERGASEPKRIAALEKLSAIYQQQVAELKRRLRSQIDPPLIQFISARALSVLAGVAPGKAAKFLAAAKPGKRPSAKTAKRDLEIAGDVVQLMDVEDMTMESATEVVSGRRNMTCKQVERIYIRRQTEARAARHGNI